MGPGGEHPGEPFTPQSILYPEDEARITGGNFWDSDAWIGAQDAALAAVSAEGTAEWSLSRTKRKSYEIGIQPKPNLQRW